MKLAEWFKTQRPQRENEVDPFPPPPRTLQEDLRRLWRKARQIR